MDEVSQVRCIRRKLGAQGQSEMGHLHKFGLEMAKGKNSFLHYGRQSREGREEEKKNIPDDKSKDKREKKG